MSEAKPINQLKSRVSVKSQVSLTNRRASQRTLTFEIRRNITVSLPPSHQEKVSLDRCPNDIDSSSSLHPFDICTHRHTHRVSVSIRQQHHHRISSNIRSEDYGWRFG